MGPMLPISECEICRELRDVETSYYKWGWDEQDRPLPPAAARLVPVEEVDSYEKERHHLKRCPLCGTLYQYDWTYEYLSNGSEDEERLVRLGRAGPLQD